MARKKHPPLDILNEYVPHPDAEKWRREAIDLMGRALTDMILTEARAEVAAELGVAPEELDRHGPRKTATQLLAEPEASAAPPEPPSPRPTESPPEGQWFAVLASRNEEELRRFDVQVLSAPVGEELARARHIIETTDNGAWRVELIEAVDGPSPPARYP